MMQPHCLVNRQSVSQSMCYDAAPVYGASSSHQELTVAPGKIAEDAPAALAEGIVEEDDEAAGKAAEDEEGEVRKPRIGRRPLLPTKADIEEHYPLHLRYRSWCPHCRAGKARLAPHVWEPSDRENIGIAVHSDFAFQGPDDEEEEHVLGRRDQEQSGHAFPREVPQGLAGPVDL